MDLGFYHSVFSTLASKGAKPELTIWGKIAFDFLLR
jgi:hypothetical protein